MKHPIVLLAVVLFSFRFTSSLPVSAISPVNQFPQGYNGGSSRKSTNPFTSTLIDPKKPVAAGFAHPKFSEVLARNEKEKEEKRKHEKVSRRSHTHSGYLSSNLDTHCVACPPIYYPSHNTDIVNLGPGLSGNDAMNAGGGSSPGSGALNAMTSSGGGGGGGWFSGWFDGWFSGGGGGGDFFSF